MQTRHKDRRKYFNELARTAERHFMPYTDRWNSKGRAARVLEVGCGEGGNLLPWARRGCPVTGIDISKERIEEAQKFFSEAGATGQFVCADALKPVTHGKSYDLIIVHDVVEHIDEKTRLLLNLRQILADGGIIFAAFPSWLMPFGGHQQIAGSKVLSHLPFVHLLPYPAYRRIMEAFGENPSTISELLDIKHTRCSISTFEHCIEKAGLEVADRRLYLINPHYETKFGLRPKRLWRAAASIPGLRDSLSTSCWYILRKKHINKHLSNNITRKHMPQHSTE